jgi:hypothetical protein
VTALETNQVRLLSDPARNGTAANCWRLYVRRRADLVVHKVIIFRGRRPVHNFRLAHPFTIPGGERGVWVITMPRKYDRTSAPQLHYIIRSADGHGETDAWWSFDRAGERMVYAGDPALHDQYRAPTPGTPGGE